MCKAYALHIVEASKALTVEIPPREVEKAFQITWPNIVRHIEDEASSVSDKKVEWYSNRHNNLTNDVRRVENKASAEQDCRQKGDKKLVQANSKITELEAKLTELQQELTVLQMQDKRMSIVWDDLYDFSGSDSEPTSDQARKGRRARHSHQPSAMGASSPAQAVGSQTTLPLVSPPTLRIAPPWGKGDPPISVTGVLPRLLRKT